MNSLRPSAADVFRFNFKTSKNCLFESHRDSYRPWTLMFGIATRMRYPTNRRNHKAGLAVRRGGSPSRSDCRIDNNRILPTELSPVGQPFPPGNLNFFPGGKRPEFLSRRGGKRFPDRGALERDVTATPEQVEQTQVTDCPVGIMSPAGISLRPRRGWITFFEQAPCPPPPASYDTLRSSRTAPQSGK